MKKLAIFIFCFISLMCNAGESSYSLFSPDKKIEITVGVTANGNPIYYISKQNKSIINQSSLGFQLVGADSMLCRDLKIVDVKYSSFDETWEQPWGESRFVRNHYNEMTILLQENNQLHRKFKVCFRAFDDGVGFRYEFPQQDSLNYFIIQDEKTEFNIANARSAWWIPSHAEGSYYESLYRNTKIAEINSNAATPFTVALEDGRYIAIHEANLTDYASMTLLPASSTVLKCELVPWANGVKVYACTPFVSPWRTIIIGDKLGDLAESRLELNLNEPCKIEDTSWIKPMKYIGIWWGMHIGKYTWYMGPHHGATTENMKMYMDFAAKNGFGGVLAEGWNYGWECPYYDGNWFNFVTPYPDFDLAEICRYGASKGVQLIGHHETYGGVRNYEAQMEEGYKLYQQNGMHALKSGYVKPKFDKTEWHDGQYGVRHYRYALEKAAEYQLTLDVHEPIKETGIRRTYPNLMSQEGARGQEFNAWSADGGNPPSHVTILPFTRLLAGPLDYTPGVFNFKYPRKDQRARPQSTLVNQLALYVVLYSPLQMACDLPENYEGFKAFDFIKDVPVDWQESKVLNAELGDYVTIARKDRNSENWYVGSVTDEHARELSVPLDFLDAKAKYVAQIYADGAKADYRTNPMDNVYYEKNVTAKTVLKIKLAPGGGQAIRIVKK